MLIEVAVTVPSLPVSPPTVIKTPTCRSDALPETLKLIPVEASVLTVEVFPSAVFIVSESAVVLVIVPDINCPIPPEGNPEGGVPLKSGLEGVAEFEGKLVPPGNCCAVPVVIDLAIELPEES